MTIIARYSRTAVILHWLVAALITVNVCLALSVNYLPDDWVRPFIDTHKSIGITVLGLAMLRLLWRAANPPPPLPQSYAGWERRVSHAVHWALYALIFCLPLSGWIHDSAWIDAPSHPMRLFGLVPWPRIWPITAWPDPAKKYWHAVFGEIHATFGYCLYALVALHIAGALKHQFIDKHPELQRMWR